MENPWDLFRRGQLDQERHLRLVREAIRKNLADLVTHGTITNGGRVKIPVKALRQWRFEFDPEQQEHTGAFSPDSAGSSGQGQQAPGRRPQKGDVVGRRPGQGQGNSSGGDGTDGELFYDVEVGVEAVAEALFADLELPRLQRKRQAHQFTEEWKMEDLRRRGSISNLDKRRTALENIARNAAIGNPNFGNLSDSDLRFRTPEVRRVPQDQVAVLFVRDRSGSMGEQEKYLTRVLAFWITRFLAFKYKKVAETAFVLFDTVAAEVTEDEFFHRSEGGGTTVSSGFRLASEIIQTRFPPDCYNVYVFAFSDGDNPLADNPEVVTIVKDLAVTCNLIGYADIRPHQSNTGWSLVAQALQKVNDDYVITVDLQEQSDVLKAMKRFFTKH